MMSTNPKQGRYKRDIPPPTEFKVSLDNVGIEELIATAKENANIFHMAEIKTNQIRNFYGAVEKIKKKYLRNRRKELAIVDVKPDLWLLLPQLAYTEGRNKSTGRFCGSMKNAVEQVLNSEEGRRHKALDHFFIYVESVVSYHKFYGDK